MTTGLVKPTRFSGFVVGVRGVEGLVGVEDRAEVSGLTSGEELV